MPRTEVLCVGELLWDALPSGLFLGGAPFNVACHLRAAGTPVAMVSRVGDDQLGREALRRAERHGVRTHLIQIDAERPTGFVQVDVDAAGIPTYEILAPAAWDAIAPADELLARAVEASAIVFGTLAQRHELSRHTIRALWSSRALMVYDVNLRPPFDDRDVVRASLERAEVVKLAEHELIRVADWFGLQGTPREMVASLARTFTCAAVCVTRGSRGAALWHDGAWTEHPGFPVQVRDTVGAGDAFLAAMLAGLLDGAADAELLEEANRAGAYVASQPGAVPG